MAYCELSLAMGETGVPWQYAREESGRLVDWLLLTS